MYVSPESQFQKLTGNKDSNDYGCKPEEEKDKSERIINQLWLLRRTKNSKPDDQLHNCACPWGTEKGSSSSSSKLYTLLTSGWSDPHRDSIWFKFCFDQRKKRCPYCVPAKICSILLCFSSSTLSSLVSLWAKKAGSAFNDEASKPWPSSSILQIYYHQCDTAHTGQVT